MTNETWVQLQGEIRKDIGEHNFKTWIAPLTFREIESRTIALSSPTEFIGTWVVQNFQDVILRHADNAGIDASRVICTAAGGDRPARSRVTPDEAAPRPSRVESTLDARFTFDSFVVGKS
ncbi:MAG: DnaA N-terminal domain-containing protein, partial [Pseudomonadota bacterium]